MYQGRSQGGAPGARPPPSDQRVPPYSAKIHDTHLCFYSETTLSLQSSRQKVEAMKWNASCAIAKRYKHIPKIMIAYAFLMLPVGPRSYRYRNILRNRDFHLIA